MKYHSAFLVVPMFVFSTSAMSAVVPTITKVSVTPTSATAGTMFKFSAELNNPLPEGYKVKIAPIGLTGFTTMISDVKNSYALSRAIYTTGKQTYKVVIVNAKNVTQGSAKTGSYTITSAAPTNHAPTLTLIKTETSSITNTVYTVTLNGKDVDANLSSITMNWGDNSEPETLTATDGKDVIFSHIYTTADSFGWNAFASDKGTPALNSKSISKIVTVSNPEPVEVKGDIETFVSGSKTFSYTKIANDGSKIPKTAKLGTGTKDWACTKDNKTGLIWQVETSGGVSLLWAKTYTNYTADSPKCSHSFCDSSTGKFGDSTNTDGFVTAVNSQTLCGANDWRLPTKDELMKLVLCSDGKYDSDDGKCTNYNSVTRPTINTIYFPNTMAWLFWSSSPDADASTSYGAWAVDFYDGSSDSYVKNYSRSVRLVR